MSYHDNGFCCLKVETGALIFSICNTLYCLHITSCPLPWRPLVAGGRTPKSLCQNWVSGSGRKQRKAGYVKAYFLYGVVVAALSLSAALAASFLSLHPTPVFYQEFPHVPIILAVIGVTLLYGLVLIMIRFTYKKFEREPKLDCSYVQKLLEEKY
ncbi:uncharacterized protein LOC126373380 isoform X2 [Pectinophora gossypiella]|uniref:uncharacterized protein LOC126373380 isoform X2 n=1 Tax=Pectinophora gossypiella TaxID=13191 RepID=UPI00214EDDFB|nr:uncharacterized protein LOC126373380 isoform X2 [Pectinophora gossypiella]